jgi:ABC-type transport system substrate-binding protein
MWKNQANHDDIENYTKNAPYMNSLENYYIQKAISQNLQLNNMQVDMQNPIFNILLQHYK